MNTWGQRIKISLFGESHGPGVGVVVDGIPAGIRLDWDAINHQMQRRAPGGTLSTSRSEADSVEILSGLLDGRTTGAPVCAFIRNTNTRSRDYTPQFLRPGHADYTAHVKYKGFADFRGGGHFSGRLTAPIVFAGAVARQVLSPVGVEIGARIFSIGDVRDADCTPDQVVPTSKKPFPVHDDARGEAMQAAILDAKAQGDSVGGVVECVGLGVPAGWGEPFFYGLESSVAGLLFAIPAIKGVEFGDGFALAGMTGSKGNDQMYMEDGQVRFESNHNGGILGGISNGQPIVVRAAVKPTATIFKPQRTVDMEKKQSVTHAFTGRHDPCIVPRALSVVEAVLAVCLLDNFLMNQGGEL